MGFIPPIPPSSLSSVPHQVSPPTRLRRALAVCAGTASLALVATGLLAAPSANAITAETRTAEYVANLPAAVSAADQATLTRYLTDTYASLFAMTDPATGLPADNIAGDLAAASRSAYTSPTNIGGYLWSTVVARDLGVITSDQAFDRMSQTLTTVAGLDRHGPSGMFYNWYDPATADRVLIWPGDGNTVHQFLSQVDNGWLAAALRIVAEAEPRLATQADALYDSMNFGIFYNAGALPDRGLGLMRGGFWDEYEAPGSVRGDYLGTGTDVFYTGHHYDTTVSETRIGYYIGIANGQVPPEAYYATWRTFPNTCDWSWQEQRPSGINRTYGDVTVFEGAYNYNGMSIVPGWGGSMFEALMPDMLVPESAWGPTSWGINHPLIVKAHKEHGLNEAGYGYWGFSPASNPVADDGAGGTTIGYAEYGVDQLGLRSDGYLSDGVTDVDGGAFGCRDATNPTPVYQDGVVTPHASFLGLSYDPAGVLENLANLEADFDMYGPGGFYDAVAVQSGTVADRYLSLDQAMIVAAIGNYLDNGVVQNYFVDDTFEAAVRPLLAAETFSASASAILPLVTTPAAGAELTAAPVQLTGTGEPGATVTVTLDDGLARAVTDLCSAPIDATGVWECDLATTLAEGSHILGISTINAPGIVVTGATHAVNIVAEAPATPTNKAETPTTPAGTETTAGATSTAGATGTANGGLASTGSQSVVLLLGGAVLALALGAGLVIRRRRLN